jgi:ACR3 family arsenite efflux pump ArsB
MSLIEKLEPLLLIVAALLGLFLSGRADWGLLLGHLVEPLLSLMLIGIFFHIPFKRLLKGFSNLKFTLSALAVNFIWTPLLGFFLAAVFLSGSEDLRIGFLMLLVTPCTDWYLVFTAMAGGNLPLSASILPLNLILQLSLLPLYLWLLGGSGVGIDLSEIAKSALPVLSVSLAGAKALAFLAQKTTDEGGFLVKSLIDLRFWFLFLAVACAFAGHGGQVLDRPSLFLWLFVPTILFFVINFVGVLLFSRLARFSYADAASLCMTSLARNSPVSLVVAAGAFPHRPLISIALIIGPLIELPTLALMAKLLPRLKSLVRRA